MALVHEGPFMQAQQFVLLCKDYKLLEPEGGWGNEAARFSVSVSACDLASFASVPTEAWGKDGAGGAGMCAPNMKRRERDLVIRCL